MVRWLVTAALLVTSVTGSNSPADAINEEVRISLLTPMTPLELRLVDTRPGMKTVDGAHAGTGRLAVGESRRVQVAGRAGVPSSASGVLVNVVAVNPRTAGYLRVYPCNYPESDTSTLNFSAGRTIANSALVTVTDGAMCIRSISEVDLVVDLIGFFERGIKAPSGGPGPGYRTVDTRVGLGLPGRLSPHQVVEIPADDGIPNGIAVVNLTVTGADEAGFLKVGCGDGPTSSLNFRAGDTVANLVIAGEGPCVEASTSVDLVVDYGPIPTDRGDLLPPDPPIYVGWRVDWPQERAVDTRTGPGRRLEAGTTTAFEVPPVIVNQPDPVPLGVRIVNVIAIDPDDRGYLTVFGCADETDPVPEVSSMNYRAGDVLAHQTFVPMGPGERMCVFTLADTDLVIDTVGGLPTTDHPTTSTAS